MDVEFRLGAERLLTQKGQKIIQFSVFMEKPDGQMLYESEGWRVAWGRVITPHTLRVKAGGKRDYTSIFNLKNSNPFVECITEGVRQTNWFDRWPEVEKLKPDAPTTSAKETDE